VLHFVLQKLKPSDKINATTHCNCTIADVEHILAKYTWAKEAQKKIVKLKEEGKSLPKTFGEVILWQITKMLNCEPHMSLIKVLLDDRNTCLWDMEEF
jgi:hypothetical protein